jgi:hypothetical protein
MVSFVLLFVFRLIRRQRVGKSVFALLVQILWAELFRQSFHNGLQKPSGYYGVLPHHISFQARVRRVFESMTSSAV